MSRILRNMFGVAAGVLGSFIVITVLYMILNLIFGVLIGVNLHLEYVQPFLKELIFG